MSAFKKKIKNLKLFQNDNEEAQVFLLNMSVDYKP